MIREITLWECGTCDILQPAEGYGAGVDKPICIQCENPMTPVRFCRLGRIGDTKHLVVSAGYGMNTKSPFVEIESADIDRPIQMLPEEARAFAMNLLGAADSAESDAFIVESFAKEMQQDMQMVGGLLVAFRQWKDRNQKPIPPNTPVSGK